MDIERIVVRMLADSTQFNRVMDGVEQRLIRVSNLGGMIGTGLTVPIVAATGAIAAFGTAAAVATAYGFRLAAAYEQAGVAFEVMTGSAEKGKKLLDDIVQLAIETPFKSPELLASAQQLKAFGVETENIVNTLRVLGDVASGVGMDKLPRIVLAFGQVRVAGRLMGPELRQFIDAGIPMIDYLARVVGKPTQAIKGMVEDAKISFADVAKAFNLMTGQGGLFFDMMDRQSQTVAGRWSAFVETIQVGLRNMGLAFFEEFGIAQGLDDLVKKMGPGGGMDFKKPFKDLREGFEWVERVVKLVVYWVDKAYYGIKDWGKANEEILTKLGKILLVTVGIVVAFKAGLVAMAAISVVVGLILSPFGALLVTVTGIAYILDEMGALKGFGDNFLKGFDSARKNLEGFFTYLKGAMVAEDWETVGKLIGKGIEIGLMTIYKSMIAEMAGILASVFLIVGREISYQMMKLEAFAAGARDVLDPSMGEGERLTRKQNREKEIEDWFNKEKKIDTRAVVGVQNRIMEELNVYQGALKKIAEEGEKLRMDKEFDKRYTTDPSFSMLIDYAKAFMKHKEGLSKAIEVTKATDPGFLSLIDEHFNQEMLYKNRITLMSAAAINFGVAGKGGWNAVKANELEDRLKQYEDIQKTTDTYFQGLVNVVAKGWNEKSNPSMQSWDMMRAGLEIWKGTAVAGTLNASRKGLGLPYDEVPKTGSQMKVPLQISAEALEYSNLISKELEKGIWGGQRGGQFDFFQKRIGLANEAYMGVQDGWLSSLFKTGAVMDKKSRDFALFEEYTNLSSAVNKRADRQPATMYRGSTEAQDTINRSMLDNKTIQEEIRDTIIQAKIIQDEQKEYQRLTVAALERLIQAGFIKVKGP